MFDNEGHWLDDPLDIVYGTEPDFSDIGFGNTCFSDLVGFKATPMEKIEKEIKVHADFYKMIAHLARVHNLKQDDILLYLADWFNEQPGMVIVKLG